MTTINAEQESFPLQAVGWVIRACAFVLWGGFITNLLASFTNSTEAECIEKREAGEYCVANATWQIPTAVFIVLLIVLASAVIAWRIMLAKQKAEATPATGRHHPAKKRPRAYQIPQEAQSHHR